MPANMCYLCMLMMNVKEGLVRERCLIQDKHCKRAVQVQLFSSLAEFEPEAWQAKEDLPNEVPRGTPQAFWLSARHFKI